MRVGQAELDSILKNCILIFILQMSLAIIITKQKPESAAKIGITSNENEVTIIVSRFICALVLHMQLEGKVLQGM